TVLDTGAYISEPYQGPPYEHFLIIERGEGLVVFSGCMHSGPQVLRAISSYFSKKVDVIIGGFHLLNAPSDIVEFYVKFLHDVIKPRVVIPLHCSGERLISELKKCRSIEVLDMGAGDEFEV
ncbi:MAG: MBL fold metallo-hydrolase, partial [Desulfurococcaceae archaeon]